MKIIKALAAAAALIIMLPSQQANAQILKNLFGGSSNNTTTTTNTTSNVASTVAALTQGNGANAGLALLGLYTQYKADGKLDFKNVNNINNLLTLASNIKGLDKLTEKAPFISGLISGSKNLVNQKNSNTVVNSLTSLAGLDLSSLGTAAAGAAASSAVSSLLGGSNTQATSQTTQATNQAASILTGLFGALNK